MDDQELKATPTMDMYFSVLLLLLLLPRTAAALLFQQLALPLTNPVRTTRTADKSIRVTFVL